MPVLRGPDPSPGAANGALPPAHAGFLARDPQARRTLRVAILNNMPDGALLQAERQFTSLVMAAAAGASVDIRYYALAEIPRGEAGLRIVRERYGDVQTLRRDRPDALIVTGAEPRAALLDDEVYWEALAGVLAWAESEEVSTLLSCLAAHAGVLLFDGVVRRRLAAKCSGVFEHGLVGPHPLTGGLGSRLICPHSRWNDLDAATLERHGYRMLSVSAEAGVHAFVKPGRDGFLFFQGHPEYEADTLLREYTRDVRRFMSGEGQGFPVAPVGCFDADTTTALDALRREALARPGAATLSRFPALTIDSAAEGAWRQAAARLVGNWLGTVGHLVADPELMERFTA